MAKLRLSLCIDEIRLPFKKALHTAAELGVEAVEFEARGELAPGQLSRTGIRQIRKMLEDYRLRLSGIGLHLKGGFADPVGVEQRVDATKAAMELAYGLGAPVVTTTIGPIPRDKACLEWQVLIEVLRDLGEFAHRTGAMLAAETVSDKVQALADVLAEVPEGTFGITLNPGHVVAEGQSLEEAISAFGPVILSVRATDADPPTVFETGSPRPVGMGAVDYPELLAALDDYGYRGYFVLVPSGSFDPVEEVASTIRYLQRL